MKSSSLACVVAATLFAAAGRLQAQQAAPWPAAGLSPDAISRMTAEQSARLPLIEMMRSSDQNGRNLASVIFSATSHLRRLYFFNGPPTMAVSAEFGAAVRTFQKSLGQPETGQLSVGQFDELQNRSNYYLLSLINPMGTNLVSIRRDFGFASGRWIIDGEAIYSPVNTSEIFCRRADMSCTIFNAELSSSMFLPTLSMHAVHYPVINWSDNEIIANHIGSCRSTTLTINSSSTEVIQTTRNSAQLGADCLLPRLPSPRVSRLVDHISSSPGGVENWRERALSYTSPDYQQSIRTLIERDVAR
ncbi:peptidoglycan-binding domain-containing protein [Roseococcus pinisoli]|uniref:Peptidoglycan-binding protein n=1 Tax=Roseococcus pinisoli TaxID=2835040 RepID=A0ABS5QD60_9PROT|nr:peptidoglycan-binding domain-containing protein [Roseococcus pinisoli]MBS7811211.1 peptidoglycan-binding protein [Roseococcus pinisoli]